MVLKRDLEADAWEVLDLGCYDKMIVDYPIYGRAMADAIRSGRTERRILICGSGIGISIAANRYPEVRAAPVHDALSAKLVREHNNGSVSCLGGKTIGEWVARDCMKVFLTTPFQEGRHTQRVKMLSGLVVS